MDTSIPFTLPRLGRGNWGEARRRRHEQDMEPVVRWMRNYIHRIGFAPVARSWLYAFESEGVITKGDFNWCGKWIADHRKWIRADGAGALIPWDFVANDESRSMSGWDFHDEAETSIEHINNRVRDALEGAKQYSPCSYWRFQDHYPIIWSEKKDLLKLFRDELPEAVKRFAGKGQANLGARIEVIKQCRFAEAHGMKPVILYCGDHDPSGIKISDGIVENLRFAAQGLGWESRLEEMDADSRVVRFGLNAEFIDNAGLLWIDGLETSRDERKGTNDLADPKHPDHFKPYVQSYLQEFGPRKCEANALIANPTAARALIRDELWRWLSHEGQKAWQEEHAKCSAEASRQAELYQQWMAFGDAAGVLTNRKLLQQAGEGLQSMLPVDDGS